MGIELDDRFRSKNRVGVWVGKRPFRIRCSMPLRGDIPRPLGLMLESKDIAARFERLCKLDRQGKLFFHNVCGRDSGRKVWGTKDVLPDSAKPLRSRDSKMHDL